MQLKLPAPILEQLRTQLIKDDELERFAYLYCGRVGDELLAADVHVVDQDDLEVMAKGACRPSLDVERGYIEDCVTSGLVPVMVHSHPFADKPGFSGVDVATMDDYHVWLRGLYPDLPFGFIVIGQSGIDTSVWDTGEDSFQPLPVRLQGEWRANRDWTLPSERSDPEDEAVVDPDRFDRSIRTLGQEGQQELASTHVAVVGCGGLGSVLIEELARLGVQEFTLVDSDVVEESNLPRLVGAMREHVDRPKVEVLENHLWHIAPNCEVAAVQSPVQEAEDQLEDVDVIMAGVDQVRARMWLNEFAVRTLTPYIDAGVIIETDDTDTGAVASEMHGFIQTVVPGVTGCFACLDRGDQEQARRERLSEEELEEQVEQGYVEESELAPEPAVIQLNGAVASMAVNEFSKLVTGFDVPTGFLRYEGLGHELVPMGTTPSGACPVCGELLGHGVDQEEQVEDDLATEIDVPA